ncbi:MAG: acyl-CoA dehydrogenase family protein [Deltaproteobacteria bacterium]|nr:acyl-CoA dehydrogenase family protein [Deltaproteobacteria bacterium]
MATALNKRLLSIQRRCVRFAGKYIAPRADLHTREAFPFDIWKAMGREGLLGLGIAEEYGGGGGNFLSLAVAGETLVREGHNLGLVLSWLIHQLVARSFITRFGTPEQRERFLPGLARGEKTACLAVSEPGRGAHPKHLTTAARREGDVLVLEGDKSYLTNGPIADLYVVVAVTNSQDDRKAFTAFLVPEETPGLARTAPLNFPFLRPSPHGGIALKGCRLPASSILGAPGRAYTDMVIPFRELEDAAMMGPLAGGLADQIHGFAGLLKSQGIALDDDARAELGDLRAQVDLLRILAYETARMMDSGREHREFTPLLLAARTFGASFQERLAKLAARTAVVQDERLRQMTNDLAGAGSVARNVCRLKLMKLGDELLAP